MSDPTTDYGHECVYCGHEHPRRGGCPLPEQPRETEAEWRRRIDLTRRAHELASRPDLIRALVARVTRQTSGGSAEHDETPGPA